MDDSEPVFEPPADNIDDNVITESTANPCYPVSLMPRPKITHHAPGCEAWGITEDAPFGYTATGKKRHMATKQMRDFMVYHGADPKLLVKRLGQSPAVAKQLDVSEQKRSIIKEVRKAKTEVAAAMAESDAKIAKNKAKKGAAAPNPALKSVGNIKEPIVPVPNPEMAKLKEPIAPAPTKKIKEPIAPAPNTEMVELKDALVNALAELKVARKQTDEKKAAPVSKPVEPVKPPPPPTRAQIRASLPVYHQTVAPVW
jgi:hypothetical protein